jgi:hypothetical protein
MEDNAFMKFWSALNGYSQTNGDKPLLYGPAKKLFKEYRELVEMQMLTENYETAKPKPRVWP